MSEDDLEQPEPEPRERPGRREMNRYARAQLEIYEAQRAAYEACRDFEGDDLDIERQKWKQKHGTD